MNVKLTKKASNDLSQIADYYDNQKTGLGTNFMESINTSISKIRQAPHASRPGLKMGTREKIVRKYPYTIVYTVKDNIIIIVTVYHQKKKRP